jgi:acyl-CoA thioester hydrolase
MPAIYLHKRRVQPAEIDELGHVNNLAYLAWMQQAAIDHSAAQGWPGERYQELGAGWVVRSHEIVYLAPAFHDDEIVVKTWVAKTQRASSLRRFEILRPSDEMVLARASTLWAFIKFASGSATRIPQEVAEAFIVLGDEPLE